MSHRGGSGNPTTAQPVGGPVQYRPLGPGNPTTAQPVGGPVQYRLLGPGNPRGVPR
jgi:hypothetical protein